PSPKIQSPAKRQTGNIKQGLKPTSETLESTNDRVTTAPVSHRLDPQRDPRNALKPPVKHPSINPPVHTRARQLHIIVTATAFNPEILSSERSIAHARSPPLPLITTTKKKASHKHLQIPPESLDQPATQGKEHLHPPEAKAGESGAEEASASRKQGRRRWSSRNLHLPETNPNLNSLFPHTEPHTIASTTDDVVTLSEVSTTDKVRTRVPTKRTRETALERQGNFFQREREGLRRRHGRSRAGRTLDPSIRSTFSLSVFLEK
ncbi:hypothetical protein HID58_037318, partial [Brassica napus]